MMLKRRRTVLILAGREGASVVVVVCYDRGVGRGVVSRYGRLKFATQNVDVCAPYKIGRNGAKMAPHVVVFCTRRRGEHDGCRVL